MLVNGKRPAFPTQTKEGLSKREWLIGMIVQGLSANPHYAHVDCELVAEDSIRQADAILTSIDAVEEVHVDA